MTNPEDDVLDRIAALVDESLEHGPTDDYNAPYDEQCEHCGGEWHGLAGGRGGCCPGAFATDDEIRAYHARRDIEAEVVAQAYYAIDDLEQLRGGFQRPELGIREGFHFLGYADAEPVSIEADGLIHTIPARRVYARPYREHFAPRRVHHPVYMRHPREDYSATCVVDVLSSVYDLSQRTYRIDVVPDAEGMFMHWTRPAEPCPPGMTDLSGLDCTLEEHTEHLEAWGRPTRLLRTSATLVIGPLDDEGDERVTAIGH
jgi:hypothetical protein